MISVYLDGEIANGQLHVGCDNRVFDVDVSALPGTAATRVGGFRDSERYLSSDEEVRQFLRLFAVAGGWDGLI